MSNIIQIKLDPEDLKKIEVIQAAALNIESLMQRVSSQTYEPDSLLRIEEVEKMIAFTRKWIYVKMKEGHFPKPIKLVHSSRWKLSDIQSWIESQKYM